MAILEDVAKEAGLTLDEAIRASEALLAALHKRLVEYPAADYLGERAWAELSDRGFYHLLGFVEQFSKHDSWNEGDICEYLGRLPPTERWTELSKELNHWKWRDSTSEQ